MASINQGDDAVARLDAAVTAFEEILTGPEGQTVAVPGHQPQPTLAERVKQNLKPSTDAAAGYAAQAREEATKAAREADRASQIAGLDAVSEAVGLAAIPFPDVWIPLSDSLRMLAGYGREVKVGDDVVARYATLTRNTTATYVNKSLLPTNAAINEARFERGGALCEPLSTNVNEYSTDFSKWSANKLDIANSTLTVNADGYASIGKNFTGGESDYTVSCYVEKISNIINQVYIQFEKRGDGTGKVGAFVNLDTGVVTTALGFATGLAVRVGAGYNIQVTAKSTAQYAFDRVSIFPSSSTNGSGVGQSSLTGAIGQALKVTQVQLEALPFATSYIPTNGAAVTRAADKLTIPRLNNDCAEWYSGPDQINPIVTADTIELYPPAGKAHLRNVRGFFTPLTPAQKAALK